MPSLRLKDNIVRRKEWVDALRAIAVFFVVLGHQIAGKTAYFVFTSPIKLPLLFMITGYVFNYRRTTAASFFRNLFFKLVIPWLCLTVPLVFVRAFFNGLSTIGPGLLRILDGSTAWYLPCLILAEIIWFFTWKTGRSTVRISLIAAAVCVLGLLTSGIEPLNFAMFNRAMSAQFFLLLGYLFRTYEAVIARLRWRHILPLVVLYLVMGCVSLRLWPNSTLDVHRSRYYNYPYCFSMIVLGCFVMFAAFRRLCTEDGLHVPDLVCFLGQTTLINYLFGGNFFRVFERGAAMLHLPSAPAVVLILGLLFSYAVCGIASLVILAFVPWVLGRKKPARQNDLPPQSLSRSGSGDDRLP